MNASTKVSYDPSNFSCLDSVAAKAAEYFLNRKDGAARLQAELERAADTQTFAQTFQIDKPEGGNALRFFTLGELADSAENEVVPQAVDNNAVEGVLFKDYGLIRKTGGGRCERLMDDIEVAFIYDIRLNTTVGPIITSGRHRTLALQIMLKAAGIAGYRNVRVRCSVITVKNQQEIQDRIISANVGSREFSRAEKRERLGSISGVLLSNCETISATILQTGSVKQYKAALSSYVKQAARELNLNTFDAAQYADAGNSLWARLDEHKPGGGTLNKWVSEDKQARFDSIFEAIREVLPTAINQALHDPAKGAKCAKIAKALAPMVASRCF